MGVTAGIGCKLRSFSFTVSGCGGRGANLPGVLCFVLTSLLEVLVARGAVITKTSQAGDGPPYTLVTVKPWLLSYKMFVGG